MYQVVFSLQLCDSGLQCAVPCTPTVLLLTGVHLVQHFMSHHGGFTFVLRLQSWKLNCGKSNTLGYFTF